MSVDIRITDDGITMTQRIVIGIIRSDGRWRYGCSAPGCGQKGYREGSKSSAQRAAEQHLKNSHM